MTNFLNLIEHIISVVSYELKTANLSEILYIGIIEFAVFYYFSKFAKNIIFKTLIFFFALYTLFGTVQDNTILTEPFVFATLGLMAPHFNIFSLLIRYIQKLFIFLKTLFVSFLNYISTPFRYLKKILEKITSFFSKKQESKQNNYEQEKTYENYFHENKNEKYEKQKSDYFKEKQRQKKQEEQEKKQQDERRKKKQQEQNNYQNKNKQKDKKTYSSNSHKKTYSRWDSSNAYEVLGVSQNATQQEIKKAFRDLAKIYHPDLTQNNKDEHKIIFQKINNAYKKLQS